MRRVLCWFVRVIATAGWLSVAGCASITTHAQTDYRVTVESELVDSIMTAGAHSTLNEGGFCLDVTVDRPSRTVLVHAAFPVENQSTNPEHFSSFTCPGGYAIAHRHFRFSEQYHGPSPGDYKVLDLLSRKPVAALIIYVPLKGHPEYIPYGVH